MLPAPDSSCRFKLGTLAVQHISALVCSAPGRLGVEQRRIDAPGEGEALVRPLRIGICGTDYHIFEGKHPFLQYPRVMGHELAVEIVSVPEGSGFVPGEICAVNPYLSCGDCRTCRAGKPNCCERISVLGVHQDGGMAELLRLSARNLFKTGGLSADACSVVEFLAIGAHAVRRGAPAPGQSALVVGAGPIGLGVALFARLAGATVSLLDLDAERAEQVSDIVQVSPLSGTEGAGWPEGGFDLVFDATGNSASMEQGFDRVAGGGTYVMVGVVKDAITFSDPDFHRKEVTLMGSRNATNEDFDRVVAAIRSGAVEMDRIITHRTTLHGAVTDLPAWVSEKQGLIKAVIELQ